MKYSDDLIKFMKRRQNFYSIRVVDFNECIFDIRYYSSLSNNYCEYSNIKKRRRSINKKYIQEYFDNIIAFIQQNHPELKWDIDILLESDSPLFKMVYNTIGSCWYYNSIR